MLRIDIPGDGTREIAHLVLDYNGAVATGGAPIDDALDSLLDPVRLVATLRR